MSLESHEWLSNNVLIGFTEKRGNAWHYREGDNNHYVGEVPMDDVLRRLFNWQALEAPTHYEYNGELVRSQRKTIIRSDSGAELGSFKAGYQPHQYDEWLVSHIGTLLDDTLHIGSAGLLKGGAVAWVSVEVPDSITTPEGVEFRPNLMAATSFDGSLSTTYSRVVQNVICDNTLAAALTERGQRVKVRHSAKSLTKINDIREALAVVFQTSDDFMQQVKELTNTQFSDAQWEQLLDATDPLPKIKEGGNTRGLTLAENKRDTLWNLWVRDERVAPWHGTAFGALQAYNTYAHHESNLRGSNRAERNMLRAVSGQQSKDDLETLTKIMELASV